MLNTVAEQLPVSEAGCDADLLQPRLLHELFEQRAAGQGSAVAVLHGREQLTYLELDRQANQLARLLRSRGVGRGHCVGLFVPRSKELYIALLAILKSGAAYVPIDPSYPADRVRFILSDSQARALITVKSLAAQAIKFQGAVISLDEAQPDLAAQSPNPLPRGEADATPDDLCYIIYTSGSTGRPKGVEIQHRSATHLVRAEGRIFQVRPTDRVYQGFSIAFDASVEEVWLAFFSGATLVAATPEMEHAGAALSGLLTQAGITVLSCVPTLLAMMEDDIPSVRLLILGGEACPPDLVKRWWKPTRRVVNTYGPTEATVIATYADCHPGKPVTIGKPLPNYFAGIFDEQMRPLPVGVPGELCLGGIGLARGYVGRPELTREKFVEVAERRAPALRVDKSSDCAEQELCAPMRLYRTGDLASLNSNGEIEFLGRIDTQVKIRGFRVELSEIESILLQCPGVKAAAVTLREDQPGVQQLVAYLVPRSSELPDEENIRAQLRTRLPAYMVPALLETLSELPTLPSGKVDRKNLPPPRPREGRVARRITPPRTQFEQELIAVWETLFAPALVSIEDDFFMDLGGHSMLAARMVSELRKRPHWETLSMLDVYRHSTLESLARELEQRRSGVPPSGGSASTPSSPSQLSNSQLAAESSKRNGNQAAPLPLPLPGERAGVRASVPTDSKPDSKAEPSTQPSPVPSRRHFLCGLAQLISLIFILSFSAIQWVGPYLVYTLLIEEEYGFTEAILGSFASLVLLYPVMLLVPIAVKWLVIGRYRPGQYPLWGTYFFRWWFVTMVESAVPVGYLAGTPWLNLYLRLMGAKIGKNVQLHTDTFVIYDLLSIGDDTSINTDSNLLGYTVEDGWLKIGRISIGKRCFIGARSAVRENAAMEDDSALEDLSLLPRGATIPCGQTWQGSPARLSPGARPSPGATISESRNTPDFPATSSARGALPSPSPGSSGRESAQTLSNPDHEQSPHRPSLPRRLRFAALTALGLLIFPVLVSAAIFPGIVLMNKLNYIDPYYWYLCLSPLVGVSFIVLLCLEIAGLKWLLLGRIQPGRYPLCSFYHFRKWFVDQTMDLTLDVVGPLYGSVYLTPWYRLLGAKVGRGAEISTASFISPDLLSIGDESFIADSVSLGAPRVRDGFFTIGNNHIGKRSFIGNSAMLPPGTVIADDSLIGCLSAPPANPSDALRPGASWLGSPAIFLPQRLQNTQFGAETTFDPPAHLRVLRAIIEFVRVILPSTCFIILLSLLFSVLLLLRDYFEVWQTLLFFPALYIGCGLAAVAVTVVAKWVLVWRYRSCERPLWSTFVWRNELLNALHEHLAEPFLVGALTGTPFVCWYFRLLGAKIGRRVYLETTDFSEFDLARIGDGANLNADCTVQTHLFEDRVMKMSTVDIAAGANVGAGSLVLYDTRMEEGASLGDVSLLMKGEVLPARTKWEGIPAARKE